MAIQLFPFGGSSGIGGGVAVPTNLSGSRDSSSITVLNSNGSGVVLSAATNTLAGVMTAAQVTAIETLIANVGATPSTAYIHDQPVASLVWNISHNLGFFPDIALFDSVGTVIEAFIENLNSNQSRVTFLLPISGTARCS
jgi:hypothetical protein